ADDNVTAANVEFFVAGASVGVTSVPAPGPVRQLYQVSWLPPVGNAGGKLPVKAVAEDTSHNHGDSQTVTIELGMRSADRINPLPQIQPAKLLALSVRPDGIALLGSD